jgi:hypothetical protein
MAHTFEDAEAVAGAVRPFAETGERSAVFIEGEYRLFVGSYLVAFLIDGKRCRLIASARTARRSRSSTEGDPRA